MGGTHNTPVIRQVSEESSLCPRRTKHCDILPLWWRSECILHFQWIDLVGLDGCGRLMRLARFLSVKMFEALHHNIGDVSNLFPPNVDRHHQFE